MAIPYTRHTFHTTRWHDVKNAIGTDSEAAAESLSILCNSYWYPLYAFIRRTGKSEHEAEDLTQDFFARLMEGKILATADPEKGKLRTFLLHCVQNFLADQHDREMALKRGGGVLVDFNPEWAEECYATEPVDNLTPDRIYQRRWALTVLEFALQLLQEEFEAQGKSAVFGALRPFLGFGANPANRYDEISVKLGIPIGTLQNQVFRLRSRWRELLFEQVALTLGEPTKDNIKEELRELLGSL